MTTYEKALAIFTLKEIPDTLTIQGYEETDIKNKLRRYTRQIKKYASQKNDTYHAAVYCMAEIYDSIITQCVNLEEEETWKTLSDTITHK